MKLPFLIYFLSVLLFSCSGQHQDKPLPTTQNKTFPKNKPASGFNDTLKINSVAAVFYSPDSLQLEKIRSVTDPGAFGAHMHEYEYLIKTTRAVLKRNFPNVKVIEAKNVRYLLFIGADKKQTCIDLNKIFDPYGLYIFDKQKTPQPVDMANAETDLGFYFSR